ncbi:MAG: polysaccharide pyruvyl transferase family protein [Candidatus Solibacter usitatus]|nr:polysaccharide pyruvyl transferase family protein [Candidatus Solibacter usitatus]
MITRRGWMGGALAAAAAAQNSQRTILLRTAWQARNIGDVCFTPAMLSAIERFLPGTKVIAWMAHRNEGIDAMVRRAHPNVELLHASFGSEGKEMDPRLRDAFARASLFLFNSGPIFSYGLHEQYSWDRTMANANLLLYAKEAGVPYGIYGQSFDRFAWPSPLLFRRLLGDAAFVFTRDTNSLRYLESLHVKPPVLGFAPDIAFHFRLRDDAPAQAFLQSKRLEAGKFLVSIVHYALLDRPGVRERGEEFGAKHRQVLANWIRETGLPVLVVAEDEREVEMGKRVLIDPQPEEIRRKMILRETFWRPDEALSTYLQSRALFSMEPHSCIFAMANGIPSLHCHTWAFGRKAEMFVDLGLGEWVFNLADADAAGMSNALLSAHRDHEAARRRVSAVMKTVDAKMTSAFDVVRRVRRT